MEKKEPKIFIIILNWNGKNDTLECLDSAREIDFENYEIVVVDNGSEDDSVQAIRSKYKDVIIIENGANLGFAEGNNVGIEYALLHEADYIFLLNNDTVVDPGVIRNLLQASKAPRQRSTSFSSGGFEEVLPHSGKVTVVWTSGYWE